MIERTLIVNADDFGQSPGLNRGIVEAHEHGIVTSASLMVAWPASADAATCARTHPALSVGLHVDLGEWMWCRGTWQCRYQRVDLEDEQAVEGEVRTQLERCRDLLGREPTHLDSHQHVHRREPVRSTLTRIACEAGVPLRLVTPGVRYHGDFYGQTGTGEPLPDLISVPRFVSSLRRLGEGVTELGCHPGYAEDLDSVYRAERTIELRTLCAGEVRDALRSEQILLRSFRELALT